MLAWSGVSNWGAAASALALGDKDEGSTANRVSCAPARDRAFGVPGSQMAKALSASFARNGSHANE